MGEQCVPGPLFSYIGPGNEATGHSACYSMTTTLAIHTGHILDYDFCPDISEGHSRDHTMSFLNCHKKVLCFLQTGVFKNCYVVTLSAVTFPKTQRTLPRSIIIKLSNIIWISC